MFRLELSDRSGSRWALYDPLRAHLIWEDSGKPVLADQPLSHLVQGNWSEVHPTSPRSPNTKYQNPERIKIQLGFACNFSCAYCSQSSLRQQEPKTRLGDAEAVLSFIEKMPSWYQGGKNGRGQGTQIEFWGGETLIYWDSVVKLAQFLRSRYPDVDMVLFTNGSLVKKEMAEFARDYRIQFSISHDGPQFTTVRSKKDPLVASGNRENIRFLFELLSPLNLVTFNAALSPTNYSLRAIRAYIAESLAVPEAKVILSFDIVTPYDQAGLSHMIDRQRWNEFINGFFNELMAIPLNELHLGSLDLHLQGFFQGLFHSRAASTLGQRCNMDSPEFLALDLKGNILTCQNVTANAGHKIGHVDDFHETRLTTAHHWSQRKECPSCPVLSLCRGACMFLEDKLWSHACDQFFAFHLPLLAYFLYLATDRVLVQVEGDTVRGDQSVRSIPVITSKWSQSGRTAVVSSRSPRGAQV